VSDFRDFFSTAAADYRRFRPQYPDALFRHLAHICTAHDLACDVGCGNGQASRALAGYFRQVTATDASAAQVAQAEPHPGVTFTTAPAETIPQTDANVDLVTVAQALHWFDHHTFFAEVERVLKPGGILAVWGYRLLATDNPALNRLLEHFYHRVVGPYWPPERQLLDAEYRTVTFPYSPLEAPPWRMESHWQLPHLLGYLQTWSACGEYQRAHGRNPVREYQPQFATAWGEPQQSLSMRWPLTLYLGRKPLNPQPGARS